MKSAKYLFLSILCAFSFSAFAEQCKTFVVSKITVDSFEKAAVITITSKNGAIFAGKDAVGWGAHYFGSQEWYNLALTSRTLEVPITVCQEEDMSCRDNGPGIRKCTRITSISL